MTSTCTPAGGAAGRSHGGATMKRPAAIAVSDCWLRATQSSSGRSTRSTLRPRASASIASAARSRVSMAQQQRRQQGGGGGADGLVFLGEELADAGLARRREAREELALLEIEVVLDLLRVGRGDVAHQRAPGRVVRGGRAARALRQRGLQPAEQRQAGEILLAQAAGDAAVEVHRAGLIQ